MLKDFTDSSEGAYCYAGLLLSGSTLYATAVSGGISSFGTVFKVNTDGSGFSVLKSFPSGGDGANPYAGLLLSGTTLYGTTTAGGIRGVGTMFKVDIDGSGYATLTQFIGADGANPSGALVLFGTNCYGATMWGGIAAQGTIFRISSDGTGYAILKDFTNSLDGGAPNGGMVLSGTTLYGTTMIGGSNGQGAVFKMNIDGGDFSVLHSFSAAASDGSIWTNADGRSPNGGLMLSGTTLYGTASQGGSNGCGTVFKLKIDGSEFSVLYAFSTIDGTSPNGSLALSGSTLYGTAITDGALGWGTVFRVDTDGSGFSVLKAFSSDDAGYPNGLVLTNDTLYGTANYAGGSWQGAIFRLNTNGSDYSVLRSLTNNDGGTPGGLILAGGTLYGYANWGGMIGGGTIFQMNANGSGYSVLKNFTYEDGNAPGGLVLSDTTLFGVTGNGGYFDNGVLFSLSLLPGAPAIQLQPQSQVLAANSDVWLQVIASGIPPPAYQWFFNGVAIDGATSSLLELTNVQTAQAGVYSVVITNSYGSMTSVLAVLTVQDPFINVPPYSQFAHAGETASFYCDAGGTPPVSFQWLKDGVNLTDGGNISGAQTETLTISNAVAADAGRYSVVLSNANGSLSSATAVLVVQDPFISRQPLSQEVSVGQLAEFDVVAYGTATSYQWTKDGAPLDDGGNISGARTSTLTLSSVATNDAGGYSIIVSNSYDVVASTMAQLVVNPTPAGAYLVLHSFTGDDGWGPWGNLASSGGSLYGTTRYGPGYNSGYAGTVFKIKSDGRGFGVLHSFTGIAGADPLGGLVLAGATLYGTTLAGGMAVDPGTVFEINVDGTGFGLLKEFGGSDGRWPNGGLVLSGSTLYGTTGIGGSAGDGTVFKINTDGSGYVVLHNFTGYPSDGYGPNGGLLLVGTTLYGTTGRGGSADYGSLFRIEVDGSGYRLIKQFDGTEGAAPMGGLVLAGTTLYGTTQTGGSSPGNYGDGTVFKIDTNGSG